MRIQQRSTTFICFLALTALTAVAVVIAVAPSSPASGAAYAAKKAKKVKRHCSVQAKRHVANKRSTSTHASSKRAHHGKQRSCKRVVVKKKAPAGVAADPPSAPTNTGLPLVTGSAVKGQTLSADNGSWSGSPTSFAYQWEDCNSSGSGCVDVAGATGSSYKLAASDVGHAVRVIVGASNAGGTTPASSAATATVAAASGEQTTWRAVGAHPLSDAEAAAAVIHRPEQRPENVAANDYVPTEAQLAAFHSAATGFSPLSVYVDGRDGMTQPSTDDLIQWASAKWGIPTDWLRAVYLEESDWKQNILGDIRQVSPEWWAQYPAPEKLANNEVYETTGISGIKWTPGLVDNGKGGGINLGTEPLRWESTAFAVDYQASIIRYYYEDCDSCEYEIGYAKGQEWNSIGAWAEPYPWINSYASKYIAKVQRHLSEKPWLSPRF